MLTQRRPLAIPRNAKHKKACVQLAEEILSKLREINDESAFQDLQNQLESLLSDVNDYIPVKRHVFHHVLPRDAASSRRRKKRRVAPSTPTISLLTKKTRLNTSSQQEENS